MRYSVKQVLISATIAILSSCAKEVLEPQQMISGDYALDDGSQVSNTYLHFENGYVIEMVASAKNTFAENYFWGCSKNDFVQKTRSSYTIQNGELITSGKNMGAISQDGDVMTLGGKKYSVLKGFKVEYYSKISLAEQKPNYTAHSETVDVTIERPINAGILTASSKTSWISDVKIIDNKTLSYTVSETNIDRNGTITLNYTNSRSINVPVSQEPATKIVLASTSGTATYVKQSSSFACTIDNPVQTSTLAIACPADWISNIKFTGEAVTFDIAENTSSSNRLATFTMKYAGARDVTYSLIQTGAPVSSLTLNKSSIMLMAGEEETLVASVTPADAKLGWASNNSSVATVNNGKVTALDAGTAIITVRAGDKMASCTVTVKDRSNNLNVTPSWTESIGLTYGNTGTITISNPSGGTLSISSQPSSSIATASLSGTTVNIMPVSSGETSITIKSAKTTGYAEATKTVTIKVLKATPTMTLSATNLEIAPEGETASVSVTTNSDGALSASSSNTAVATTSVGVRAVTVKSKDIEGNATITVTCAETGKYKEISKEVIVTVTYLVDLGLSVKWAICNLGASKREEHGGYYQWAGKKDVTSTSINLYWGNCPYHSGSYRYSGWTKYVRKNQSSYWSGSGNPDNKMVLDPEDDVVYVNLGGKWRMPTIEEWSELKDNCTWTWTTQNGVEGYKVVSKKTGYLDKWIFLPAAGYRSGYLLHGVGLSGRYWSSSLSDADEPSFAWVLFFYSNDVDTTHYIYERYYGLSIRPVSD